MQVLRLMEEGCAGNMDDAFRVLDTPLGLTVAGTKYRISTLAYLEMLHKNTLEVAVSQCHLALACALFADGNTPPACMHVIRFLNAVHTLIRTHRKKGGGQALKRRRR